MIVLAVIMCILGILGAGQFLSMVGEKLGLFPGCLTTVLGLIPLGLYISGVVFVGLAFGAPGVAIVNILGIILGIVGLKFTERVSSSSSDPVSNAVHDSGDRRRKGERTCFTCNNYSITRGVCKFGAYNDRDTPKSPEQSCGNWH